MKTKVLIVEDEGPFARSLAQLLNRHGIEAWQAGDIDTALDLAARVRPDVLVVDWMLKSHSDGIDLAQTLQRGGLRCRVIIMSGFPSPDLGGRLDGIENASFLAKPFGPDELLALIRPD